MFIESPFNLIKVKRKKLLKQYFTYKANVVITPEAFDAVDVGAFLGNFFALIDNHVNPTQIKRSITILDKHMMSRRSLFTSLNILKEELIQDIEL